MRYCIIGSGAAGIFAAKKIRQLDKDGEIIIFSDEKRGLFAKPRLPEFLAGDCSEEDLIIFKPDWYEKQKIILKIKTAVRTIDPDKKAVITAAGERVLYDKLLIATGGHPMRLPIKGINSENVFTIRTIEDVRSLQQCAATKKCCIVLGGGLLGIEIAYALSKTGTQVTVVEYFDRLIPRQLDEEGSHLLKEMLQNKGLTFILGAQSTGIEDVSGEKQLSIKGQSAICCEFIVMSVGIRPDSTLAQDAGINVNKGIIVDSFLQTNSKDIFAAGDCAEYDHRVYGLWSAAMEQGERAGENMVLPQKEYTGTIVSTMLKVAGIEVASVGEIDNKDDTVYEVKKMDGGCYKKIFLQDKCVIGAVLIGCNKEAIKIKKMINERTIIHDPEGLL